MSLDTAIIRLCLHWILIQRQSPKLIVKIDWCFMMFCIFNRPSPEMNLITDWIKWIDITHQCDEAMDRSMFSSCSPTHNHFNKITMHDSHYVLMIIHNDEAAEDPPWQHPPSVSFTHPSADSSIAPPLTPHSLPPSSLDFDLTTIAKINRQNWLGFHDVWNVLDHRLKWIWLQIKYNKFTIPTNKTKKGRIKVLLVLACTQLIIRL